MTFDPSSQENIPQQSAAPLLCPKLMVSYRFRDRRNGAADGSGMKLSFGAETEAADGSGMKTLFWCRD